MIFRGSLPHFSQTGRETPLRLTSVGVLLLPCYLIVGDCEGCCYSFLHCCIRGLLCLPFGPRGLLLLILFLAE